MQNSKCNAYEANPQDVEVMECFKKNSVFRALALSIIPSMLFLFSGIMSRSVLLIIASVLFAPSHIVISYKNVK